MLVYADRVKETTATTGTGTLTLAGAVTGFRAFSAIGNGNQCYYRIENGSAWEIGIGTYTSSGTTLSRDVILASTNAGAAINLSGTSEVFHDIPATLFSNQIRVVQAHAIAASNVTLATDCEAGDVVNGVTLTAGMTLFTPNQSTAADRRIWIVKASGAPDPHPLMPTGDVISSFLVCASDGTSLKDRLFNQTANTVTVGSGGLTWVEITAGTDTERPNKLINTMGRTWGHSYTSPVSITDGGYPGPTGWFFLVDGNLCEASLGTGFGSSSHSIKVTNNSGADRRVALSQFVEYYDALPLRGKTVCFSIKLKRSTTGNVRLALVNWTGTANAPTKDIVGNWSSTNYTEGNFFISSGSLDIVAVSDAISVGTTEVEAILTGAVGGSTNNLQVIAWTEGVIEDEGTIEFGELILNKGTVPVTFDAQHYPDEIIDCEYRCRMHNSDGSQTDAILGWGHGASTTVAVCQVPLGHGMRVVPSLLYTGSDWQVADSVGARQDVTALAISSTVSSRKTLFMTATVASGLTVGRGMATVADSTAGRFLVLDAEIGV